MLNTIIHGDCLKIMPEIPDGSINMILCDLPYGKTSCSWDKIIPIKLLWEHYERIIKQNGAIVLTASQPFTSMLVMSNLPLYKYEWVWFKNMGGNPMLAKFQPMNVHESVLVFGKGRVQFNPQMQQRAKSGLERIKRGPVTGGTIKEDAVYSKVGMEKKRIEYGELKNPTTVQTFNVERGLHPTQKPVTLFEYLIKTYTNPGDVVLDNCIGSGTTAVAAINTGRSFIGIEREEKYVEIARNRIDETMPIHIY